MRKRSPNKSNEEWRQIILDAKRSGMSDFEYCKMHGITPSAFYRAVKRMRRIACAATPTPSNTTIVPVHDAHEVVQVNFNELPLEENTKLSAKEKTMTCDTFNNSFAATIRLVVGGSTLELTNEADPGMVSSLIRVLKSSC
ncbi:MAG: hypothetical protein K5851_02115 [Lachnospiraceae bacterium]|nr:hypothetical protein [Lachnospiraceae bacterium]